LAYRKAAWSVDEWPDSVGDLYAEQGEAGLRTLPAVGQRLASHIAQWLHEEREASEP